MRLDSVEPMEPLESLSDNCRHDTCFFERYAQISLASLMGGVFGSLVNRDRPDLQSPDGRSVGIEVTRAMEEKRTAQEELLQDLAGITKGDGDGDLERIREYGYGFGLRGGRYIGSMELPYWRMALPMKRILASKVAKVGNGFYGHFDKMGLFVFSKDDLGEGDALKTMTYILDLQKYIDNKYDWLFLADVNDLFACNLDDGVSLSSRLVRYRISQEQRREFYLKAVEKP